MNAYGYLGTVILLGVIAVAAVGVSNYAAFTGKQVSTTSQSTSTAETSTSSSSLTTGSQTSQTTTSTSSSENGTLDAGISIGPIQPVCFVHTNSTAPPYNFSSKVVITGSDGTNTTYPVSWVYDGCSIDGSLQVSLASGDYQLNLSGCSFMGCRSALPSAFMVIPGRTTVVDVSIFTGIA